MGFDIALYAEGNLVRVQRHAEGSTYAIGGTDEASIKVTYNYSSFYYQALDGERGLRWLDGKAAAETIEQMEAAIQQLGTERYTGPFLVPNFSKLRPSDPRWQKLKDVDLEDPANAALRQEALASDLFFDTGGYWKGTPGNAGYILSILLTWARAHPTATWRVD